MRRPADQSIRIPNRDSGIAATSPIEPRVQFPAAPSIGPPLAARCARRETTGWQSSDKRGSDLFSSGAVLEYEADAITATPGSNWSPTTRMPSYQPKPISGRRGRRSRGGNLCNTAISVFMRTCARTEHGTLRRQTYNPISKRDIDETRMLFFKP